MLLGYGAYVHSPTLNEPAHLVAGISNWDFGTFDVYKVNPPLARMVAALPVLCANCKTDWKSYTKDDDARFEFKMGKDFVTANGERSTLLFTLARWSCVPFNLLGGYLVFRWSRELYGTIAGLLSQTIWCFCPNLLGHGQCITSDSAAAALGLAACYAFWKWLRTPSWSATLVSGSILGLAELTKTTLLIFYPLWPLMWLAYRWPARRQIGPERWGREFGMLFIRMLLAVYVINMGYLFEGSCVRLGDFSFRSALFSGITETDNDSTLTGNRFANGWMANIPVPLPSNYLLGIDQQRRDFENYHNPSYLGGTFQSKGWWYYYIYAVVIKVPIGTWILVAIAAATRLWSRSAASFRDECFLLSPAIVIFLFVSSQTGFSEHMRYVLPCFPFVFVWTGRISSALAGNRMPVLMVTIALTASTCSSLYTYPHSLSYFSEIIGGPMRGSEHLINSNIDWGQDLLYLKHWLKANNTVEPIKLAYFGFLDPRDLGVRYVTPSKLPKNRARNEGKKTEIGTYAISVNLIRGLPHAGFAQNDLAGFQNKKPVAMAGYSLWIYRVDE